MVEQTATQSCTRARRDLDLRVRRALQWRLEPQTTSVLLATVDTPYKKTKHVQKPLRVSRGQDHHAQRA